MKEFSIPESRRCRVGSRRDGIIERNDSTREQNVKPGKTLRFRSNKFVETNRSNRIPSTTVDYVTRAMFIRISIARFWHQVLNLIRYRRVFVRSAIFSLSSNFPCATFVRVRTALRVSTAFVSVSSTPESYNRSERKDKWK